MKVQDKKNNQYNLSISSDEGNEEELIIKEMRENIMMDQ